jgi:hypothetical protein
MRKTALDFDHQNSPSLETLHKKFAQRKTKSLEKQTYHLSSGSPLHIKQIKNIPIGRSQLNFDSRKESIASQKMFLVDSISHIQESSQSDNDQDVSNPMQSTIDHEIEKSVVSHRKLLANIQSKAPEKNTSFLSRNSFFRHPSYY